MTIKEMENAIESGEIPESKIKKCKLQIATAKSLSREMYHTVQGAAINKSLREFLESPNFTETIDQIICHTSTSIVDSQRRLTTKELVPIKNKNAGTEELLAFCEKLRVGMQDILINSTDLDYDTILFQGLFVYYTDNLQHKLESHKQ